MTTGPRTRLLSGVWLAVALVAWSPAAASESERERDRGFAVLGAFFVTEIDTELSVFSTEVPIGARIELDDDLGLARSANVPRASVDWNLGRRSILGVSYFGLNRDGFKSLDRLIELPPDLEFPVGAEIESVLDSEVFKLQYTWIFHSDDKVRLGVGAGLFVSRIAAGLRTSSRAGETVDDRGFDESVTAPLPVVGGRLQYRIAPKLDFTASADLFLIRYGGYAGSLTDLQFYVSHRTFRHVGFAAGLNLQNIDLEIDDDDLVWTVDEGLTGFIAALTFYF